MSTGEEKYKAVSHHLGKAQEAALGLGDALEDVNDILNEVVAALPPMMRNTIQLADDRKKVPLLVQEMSEDLKKRERFLVESVEALPKDCRTGPLPEMIRRVTKHRDEFMVEAVLLSNQLVGTPYANMSPPEAVRDILRDLRVKKSEPVQTVPQEVYDALLRDREKLKHQLGEVTMERDAYLSQRDSARREVSRFKNLFYKVLPGDMTWKDSEVAAQEFKERWQNLDSDLKEARAQAADNALAAKVLLDIREAAGLKVGDGVSLVEQVKRLAAGRCADFSMVGKKTRVFEGYVTAMSVNVGTRYMNDPTELPNRIEGSMDVMEMVPFGTPPKTHRIILKTCAEAQRAREALESRKPVKVEVYCDER